MEFVVRRGPTTWRCGSRAGLRRDALVWHRRVCGRDRRRARRSGTLACRRSWRDAPRLSRRSGPRVPDGSSGHRGPRPDRPLTGVRSRPSSAPFSGTRPASLGSATWKSQVPSRSSPGPRPASVRPSPAGWPRPGRPSWSPTCRTRQGQALADGDRRRVRQRRRHRHRPDHVRRRPGQRARRAADRGELRRHRPGGANCRPRRQLRLGARPRPLQEGHRDQPDRHVRHDPDRRHRHVAPRPARVRRARCDREHGERCGVRRPDRPGGVLLLQGRHRRHDPAGGARPRR